MQRILVWDIPTRAFHWFLTGVFSAALVLAMASDDESPAFQLHMLLGLIAAFMVVLRLVWGVIGSRYARFGSFLFGPGAVFEYLRDVFSGKAERHIGHNPGSAVAIYLMLALTLGLGLTGPLIPTMEVLGEPHEGMGHFMVLVVAAHLAGVVWHTIRHKEAIALSMIHGRKQGEPSQAIGSSHLVAGLVFVLLTAGFSAALFSGHDLAAGVVRLPVIGATIQLGEVEGDEDEGLEHDDHEDDEGGRDHDDD
jgi:cytochrome b